MSPSVCQVWIKIPLATLVNETGTDSVLMKPTWTLRFSDPDFRALKGSTNWPWSLEPSPMSSLSSLASYRAGLPIEI